MKEVFDFQDKYNSLQNQTCALVAIAKNYIFHNWEKVQDWSDLNILLYNRNITYNKNKSKSEWFSKKSYKMLERIGSGVNPIKTLEIIYDEIDSDMSVTINGKEFWWIPDNNVIDIADYIETYLKITK